MATSLLADSLAVACQTILARSTAAGELKYARKVSAAAVVLALLEVLRFCFKVRDMHCCRVEMLLAVPVCWCWLWRVPLH
jgi:hypothetical protein